MLSILLFNVTAPTGIYSSCHSLSLHDALPIYRGAPPTIAGKEAGEMVADRGGDMVKKRGADETPFMEAPAYGRSLAGLSVNLLVRNVAQAVRSEEHTSELQSLMRISYAVVCLQKKIKNCPTNQ